MGQLLMELAIMCGLPLSGKTTYAKQLRHDEGWVVICPDNVRLALHGKNFYPPAEPFVWAVCELVVRSLLLSEHRVLIDATNTTRKRRKTWLDMAQEFGIALQAFVIDESVEECQHRADVDNKPYMKVVIERMASQWEPVEEEGIEIATLKKN